MKGGSSYAKHRQSIKDDMGSKEWGWEGVGP